MSADAPTAPLRILFLGSGAFGLPTLEALSLAHNIVGVVTQPDRPAGRGKKITPSPVGQWAADRVDPARVFKPGNINDPGVVESLHALRADAWVIIAYGQKLGRPLLGDSFAINLHASLLPRWRGAAPINHALWAGDAETGNSVITIADRMDAGFVLAQSRRVVDPMTTAGEMHDLLAADGPALIMSVLDDFAHGRVRKAEQDESLVTHARKLSKADGVIDPHWPAERIRRTVHALTPWPGVAAILGGQPMKLLRVQDLPSDPESTGVNPGTLLDAKAGLVACGGGTCLRLIDVQPEGRRAMRWDEFAAGRTFAADATLEGGRC
ncbi:MAG: methionyl-tRNA formyltransferase [Phycisphaerales bacterium]